jgi:hypothetical protein
MRQHIVGCVCVTFSAGSYVEFTYLPSLNVTRTHPTKRMLPHHQKIWLFTVLISDFNKEQYEIPEDDLETDRNVLESFKCFNATILD